MHGDPPGSPFLTAPSNLGQRTSLGSQVAQGQKRQDIQPLLSSPEALEEKGVSGQGGSPRSDPCPPRGCGDRCLSVRLGRNLAAQDHEGQMEHTAQVETYKCA